MAKETDETQWESIPTGGISGDEWDFTAENPLIGTFQGIEFVTTKKPRNDGSDKAAAYIFDVNGHRHFLWGTAQLDAALGVDPATNTSLVRVGDLVRITYRGKVSLDDGRQMHSYTVDAAKRS